MRKLSLALFLRLSATRLFSFCSLRLVVTWLVTSALLMQASFPLPLANTPLVTKKKAPLPTKAPNPKTKATTAQVRNATPFVTVSGSSYEPQAIAPEAIVSGFGTSLATGTAGAPNVPLPTNLLGTTVTVTDSAGVVRLAPLFFVSPLQINYLIPTGTAVGAATVEVRAGNSTISLGTITINSTGPGIFTETQDGKGVVAAELLRLKADGSQSTERLSEVNPATGRITTRPIDLGPATDRVFLQLYVTGVRGAADPNNDGNANETVRLLLGGTEYLPLYAGKQPQYVGLDQVNSPELPRSLAGRGKLSLALAIPGVATSNLGEIEIGPLAGSTAPTITGLNPTTVTAGQELILTGSGFATTAADNTVRLGGVEAEVTEAAPAQLKVRVPFGAESSRVSVRTPNGEGRSANAVTVTTSISGLVETTHRQPLSGVTLKVSGTSLTTTTNAEGAFLLPNAPTGTALIEVDASSIPNGAAYPKLTLPLDVLSQRDNQFPQPIVLQPASNASLAISAAGLAETQTLTATMTPATGAQPEALLAEQIGLEVPVGARITFADHSNSGSITLSVVAQARTPVKFPAGFASHTVAQITPLGAHLDIGAKLRFPNSDGYAAGETVKLFHLEQRQGYPNVGRFVELGTATVSSDGQRIETPDGAITQTGYYLVAGTRPTTTIIGHVVEAGGLPVRRALVHARGQEAMTDGQGGFLLRQVPMKSGESFLVEATFLRPQGRIERVERANVTGVANGITTITPDLVLPAKDSNRPPLVLAPTSLRAVAGQTSQVEFVALDREPGQTVTVTVTGAAFASVVNRGNNQYTLRLTPGLADVKDYALVLTATDNLNAATALPLNLSVLPSPPQITDFTPKTACVGNTVTISGTSLKAGAGNPVVSFVGSDGRRIQALVAAATATEVRVTVPNGAATGALELSNDYGGPTRSASAFAATPAQDFALLPAPSSATAVQGTTATYVVSLSNRSTCSATELTQLVRLSVEGLPNGAKASFNPETITAGATSTLSVVLPGNMNPDSYQLTIKGKTTVDGSDLERAASASLSVQATGQTTLSGRVLDTKEGPIVGATVALDGKSTTTDAAGAFLLVGITEGVDRPVMVNGRTASAPGREYPIISEPVTILANQANVVPYTFYLPIIDTANEVTLKIGAPTEVTTPMAPGLKMMVPANANLRRRDGTPITKVSLTCVEPDRLPAPLPANLGTPMVYTAQPGDVRPAPGVVMPVTYPNLGGAEPGTRIELWNFDPDTTKWYIYGYGRVSKDGRLIEPEPGVGLPYFSWAFPVIPNNCDAGTCCDPQYQCCPGITPTPVDLSAGLKIERATDIAFGGARGGLELTRIHTTNLATSGCSNCSSFGNGMTHNYAYRLSGGFEEGGAGRFFQPEQTVGRLFSYTRKEADGSLVFTTTATPHQLGDIIRKLPNGTVEYRYKTGEVLRFNAVGSLIARVDRNGNTTTLEYAGSNLMRVTDPVGRSLSFEYRNGNISKVTDPLGRSWTYTYAGTQLTAVKDPLGYETKYAYDRGRLVSVTDKRGNVTKRITYDERFRVIEQKYADGGWEKYFYGYAGNMVIEVTITNNLGRSRYLRFNGAGQVIEMVDELGQKSEIVRDMTTNVPLERKGPCGCAEDQRKYDARGNAIEIKDRAGNTAKYDYEAVFNNLTKMTDRNGNVSQYDYDTRGNRTSVTNALSQSTNYSYDSFGQLTRITDALNHAATMEYDAYGNVKARTDALGNKTLFDFDLVGRLKSVTDPLGRTTTLTYDDLDRLKTSKDASGAVTTYDYDPNGNQIAVTDALNQKWTNTYDPMNRLMIRTDPLGCLSRMHYNTAGEMTATVSPSGRTNTYEYDARGQRTAMTDGMGGVVRFTYDAQKNMLTLTDQRGNTTTFTYDDLYRVVSRRDPVGKSTSFAYDAEGNLKASVDRMGRRTTVTYDAVNRREQVNYADAVVKYAYDAAGRLRRIDDTQADGALEWAYDDANRLLSETTPQGIVKYTYNNANQRASMTAADRPPVTYSYDTAGRLRTITQGTEVFTYSYDTLSRQTRLDRPNGVKTEYSYDTVNRLKQLKHSNALNVALEDFQYTFNADNEIDAIQSLASATRLPERNRDVNAADAANRIPQFGQASYTFDAEGQTKTKTEADGTDVYDWDARGRLTKVTLPNGQVVSYVYDALGRRSNRTARGATTTFLHDGQDVVLDRTGNSAVEYLNGVGIDDKLRQMSAGMGSLYFLRDHLGSTAGLMNSMGSLLEQGQYEAFGVSAGSALTPYGFTSRELDTATAVMYYRARWYDTQQGRFITEDPLWILGGLNLYEYVLSNPVTNTDPQGTCGPICAGIVVGIVVAIVGGIIQAGITHYVPPYSPNPSPQPLPTPSPVPSPVPPGPQPPSDQCLRTLIETGAKCPLPRCSKKISPYNPCAYDCECNSCPKK